MCCSLHLVEKEVSPRTVLPHVIEVQKFFRNHHQPQGWLREKDGLKPQIPNDTRWNSQEACMNTFLKNYQKYQEICIDHSDEVPLNIIKIIKNANLHMKAIHPPKHLRLVSFVLNSFKEMIVHWVKLFIPLVWATKSSSSTTI